VLTAEADSRRPLVFSWGVSSFFGWGVYGVNLALSLANHPHFRPLSVIPFDPDALVLDPLRAEQMRQVALSSEPMWRALAAVPEDQALIDAPVLIGLGSDLHHIQAAGGKSLSGQPPIGVVFLAHARLDDLARRRAEQFALIVAGSSWNEAVLRDNGIDSVTFPRPAMKRQTGARVTWKKSSKRWRWPGPRARPRRRRGGAAPHSWRR
jgi:hypothetical protein